MHRQSKALARKVHGVAGLSTRLSDEQKAEVAAGVALVLGVPPQSVSGQDRDRVLWLLLGNVPPICRGVDELAEGVRLALVISERYMRGEFDASADVTGKVNPFHEVALTLRKWLPGSCVEPEKTTAPVCETEAAGGQRVS